MNKTHVCTLILGVFFLFGPVFVDAFSLSPIKQLQTVDPGESGNFFFSLEHGYSVSKTYRYETYQLHLNADGQISEKNEHPWVNEQGTLVVGPGEVREVEIPYEVGEHAPPGSTMLAVQFYEVPDQGQIQVRKSIIALADMIVSGEVRVALSDISIEAPYIVWSSLFFYDIFLENEGNITLQPTVIATIDGETKELSNRSVLPSGAIAMKLDHRTRAVFPQKISIEIEAEDDRFPELAVHAQKTLWYVPKGLVLLVSGSFLLFCIALIRYVMMKRV